jgi:ATP-dependent Zn protease
MVLTRNQQEPHPRFWRRYRLWIILLAVPLVALAGVFVIGVVTSHSSGAESVSYSLFITQVKDHNVSSVTLTRSLVTGTFKSPVASDQTRTSVTMFTTTLPNLHANVLTTLLANRVKVNVTNGNSNGVSTLLVRWVPTLLLAGMVYLILVGCLALYLSGRPRPPTRHTLA